MPNFKSAYFQIELPEHTVDASSYCFALPVSGRFHPSIVIKFDDLPKGKTLKAFVDTQVGQSREQLKNFRLLNEPQSESPTQIILQFQWGEGDSAFRQTQIFQLQGERVFILTGTLLAPGGLQHAKLLADTLRTFKPS